MFYHAKLLFLTGAECGDGAKHLELLTTAILQHWKPIDFDPNALILNELNISQAQNERGFAYVY